MCDPWYGCWNVDSSQSVADWSTWRLGWMGGAGLNFEVGSGASFFIQAQYHVINNTHAATEMMPIAMGYRVSF